MTTGAAAPALVALDGSGTAEYVLPWALAFVQALKLPLALVEMVPRGDGAAAAAAAHYLDGVAASLRSQGIEVSLSTPDMTGDPAEEIVAAANRASAALIMLATHGRSGVSRVVLGSVTDAVVRSATRPVLVVRAGTEKAAMAAAAVRRVLVTVDRSPLSESALTPAIRYAQGFGATLDLLHVAPLASMLVAGAAELPLPEGMDEQIEQGAEAYLRTQHARCPGDLAVEMHVLRGPAADGIVDYAESSHADLLVMATHGRSGVARWTLGSVADKVLRSGVVPVVLVRDQPQQEKS